MTKPMTDERKDYCCCCNGQINGGVHNADCATPVVERLKARIRFLEGANVSWGDAYTKLLEKK